MARYTGGSSVPGGYYLNPRRLTLTSVLGERGTLPGSPAEGFHRVPWPVALAAAPVLGGLYVVALPFIGIATLLGVVGERLSGSARSGARDLAATMTPGWRPGEAHLTGTAADAKPEETPAGGAGESALAGVADEIARKRREEGDA